MRKFFHPVEIETNLAENNRFIGDRNKGHSITMFGFGLYTSTNPEPPETGEGYDEDESGDLC